MYLVWILLGIIFFLRSLYSKFSVHPGTTVTCSFDRNVVPFSTLIAIPATAALPPNGPNAGFVVAGQHQLVFDVVRRHDVVIFLRVVQTCMFKVRHKHKGATCLRCTSSEHVQTEKEQRRRRWRRSQDESQDAYQAHGQSHGGRRLQTGTSRL